MDNILLILTILILSIGLILVIRTIRIIQSNIQFLYESIKTHSEFFEKLNDRQEKKVPIDIAYLCDGKQCPDCNSSPCIHTFNIDHAIHKDDLNERLFEYINGRESIGFFEIDKECEHKDA